MQRASDTNRWTEAALSQTGECLSLIILLFFQLALVDALIRPGPASRSMEPETKLYIVAYGLY